MGRRRSKKRKPKIKDKLRQLKEYLEERQRASEEKVTHAENYSTKIVGMLGDMAKQIIKLEERIARLEHRK